MKNTILPYNQALKELAKQLRKQGVLSEVLLWQKIKNKSLGVEFHRQLPIDNFIVDFYCQELMLAIEIDGNSHLNADVQINDDARQKTIEKLGVTFIRFNDFDVKKNMSRVLECLQNQIEQLQNK